MNKAVQRLKDNSDREELVAYDNEVSLNQATFFKKKIFSHMFRLKIVLKFATNFLFRSLAINLIVFCHQLRVSLTHRM